VHTTHSQETEKSDIGIWDTVFSEREFTFTFAICRCASIYRLSVCNVHAPRLVSHKFKPASQLQFCSQLEKSSLAGFKPDEIIQLSRGKNPA